jgi:hypothetical protein
MFLTIQKLIHMIDATLSYPFFSRDSSGKNNGATSSAEWHGENSGVFVINSYYKKQVDYDKKIKELGEGVLDMDEKGID